MGYYVGGIFLSSELYHHGIKGQKWGIRRFQNEDGSLTPAGKERYGRSSKSRSEINAEKIKVSKGTMGYGEEYIATAVALVVTTVIAKKIAINHARKYYNEHSEELDKLVDKTKDVKYSDIYHVNSNEVSKYMKNREENEKLDKKTGLYLKQSEMSEEEDMKAVNPEYKDYAYARVNCGLCSLTYDIRRRGYDVIAGYSDDGITPGDIEKRYPGAKRKDLFGGYSKSSYTFNKPPSKEEARNIVNNMSKEKNTRGAFYMIWAGSSDGHCIAYDVTSSGDVILRDAQTGKSYEGAAATKLLRSCSYLGYTRLDNVEPDYELLKKEGIIR